MNDLNEKKYHTKRKLATQIIHKTIIGDILTNKIYIVQVLYDTKNYVYKYMIPAYYRRLQQKR